MAVYPFIDMRPPSVWSFTMNRRSGSCAGIGRSRIMLIRLNTTVVAAGAPEGEIYTQHGAPDQIIEIGNPIGPNIKHWNKYLVVYRIAEGHKLLSTLMQSDAFSNIAYLVENGKVVSASARQNEDYLIKMHEADAGSRYLGEYAIGTNTDIDRFTGNILFDEKIGGTMHLALGSGFPQAGGKNTSGLHWDMICDLREEGEVYADGELVWKDGRFLAEPALEVVESSVRG